MAWSGGTYRKGNYSTNGWTGDASLGIGIEAGRHDTQDDDFANGINQCLNKDGSNTVTGNLNFGGYIPTNLGAGTAAAPAICAGNDINTGIFSPGADEIGIATNGTEKIRIKSDGKVGIGTTTPSAPLTVVGSSNPLLLAPNNAATWSQTNLHIRNSGLSDGSPNSVYMGVTGTQFYGVAFIDTNPAVGSAAATPLAIYTAGVERMRIASSGEIGMNAAPATGSTLFINAPGTSGSTWAVRMENSSAQGLFSVDGAGNIYTGGAASSPNNNTTGSAANLYVGPTGILQKSTSSERYKTDIRPYTHGLAEVALLAPKFYKGINDGDIQFAGLIAEDVHDAGLTEFVVYNEDNEPDALHYGNMVALAFKAIQELNAKVEALEARVTELEA